MKNKKGCTLAKVAKAEGESLVYQAKESAKNPKASKTLKSEAKVVLAKKKNK